MNNLPFGFTPGGDSDGFDMSKLGEMLQQVGAMMQRAEHPEDSGPVSWATIRDTARAELAKVGDPAVTAGQQQAAASAVELAQLWLDAATALPASGSRSAVWSSSDWLEQTLDSWRVLVDPVAAGLAQTIAQISTEAIPQTDDPATAQLLQPMIELAKRMSAVTTGMQIGQGFAAIAREMLTGSEVGLPLSRDFVPALLPGRITDFAVANELPANELMLYVAIREAALQRLYAANPWLKTAVTDAVCRFARGIAIDGDAIRAAIADVDPADPASMQQLVASGAFQPSTSPDQQRALDQIELVLATIEGWVDCVTTAAIQDRIARAGAIGETISRRRVSGGPAEHAFANLVGLELRPRLIRQAAAFWNGLTEAVGQTARDAFWAHPDLAPTQAELADVPGFLTARADLH